jgi:hypothetical protein
MSLDCCGWHEGQGCNRSKKEVRQGYIHEHTAARLACEASPGIRRTVQTVAKFVREIQMH